MQGVSQWLDNISKIGAIFSQFITLINQIASLFLTTLAPLLDSFLQQST